MGPDIAHWTRDMFSMEERAQAGGHVLEVLAWMQAPHVEKAQRQGRRPTSDDVVL